MGGVDVEFAIALFEFFDHFSGGFIVDAVLEVGEPVDDVGVFDFFGHEGPVDGGGGVAESDAAIDKEGGLAVVDLFVDFFEGHWRFGVVFEVGVLPADHAHVLLALPVLPEFVESGVGNGNDFVGLVLDGVHPATEVEDQGGVAADFFELFDDFGKVAGHGARDIHDDSDFADVVDFFAEHHDGASAGASEVGVERSHGGSEVESGGGGVEFDGWHGHCRRVRGSGELHAGGHLSDLGLRRWFSDFFRAGGLFLGSGGRNGGDLGGRRAGDDDDQDTEKQGEGRVDDDGHDDGGGFLFAVVGIGYGGKFDDFVWQYGGIGEVIEGDSLCDGFFFGHDTGDFLRRWWCGSTESHGDNWLDVVEFGGVGI